jgi:phosphoribosylformylglycinamidine cyclo-ligase
VSPGKDAGARAYAAAGVDLGAAAEAVARIREVAAAAVRSPEVIAGIGGFAGVIRLGDGRVLAAGTDGVGTKVEVARALGRYDTVGIDLVAMCANDVVCTGVAPLFFLDYLAVGRVDPEQVAAIVSGVAEGCRRARCVLLGGETAEHPGVMADDQFDLAGFCVGLGEEASLFDANHAREGDILIGLPSTGLHSNGFSLVRRAFGVRDLDRHVDALGRTLAEELMEPTAIYVDTVLAVRHLAVSVAHITGGGLFENLPRALPKHLGAVIHKGSWTVPPMFGLVAEAAGIRPDELFGVLNMGIGMVVVVHPEDEAEALREAGRGAVVIGEVSAGAGVSVT